MSRAFQILTCAALIATLAVNAGAQTIDPNSTSASANGTSIPTSENGEFEADLTSPDHSAPGLSDFAIEFSFRAQSPSASDLNLKIEAGETGDGGQQSPILNLSCDARTGWGV